MSQTDLLPSGHAKIQTAELHDITIRFPGVIANDHVNFDVKAGEIHALLGENGAGKSTLMKILYGLYRPDEGQILLNGQEVKFHSPADSLAAGIGMIHQHFMLVETLTVAENVALGLKSTGFIVDLDAVRQRLRELSQIYGLKINPDASIWQLSVGEQQRVEIIKALYRGGALVILDEPTAVLTPPEVKELSATLKQMREQGHALIFISHKLQEVQDLSDRVSVLRDGRLIDTVVNDHLDQRVLARMMVGRDVQFHPVRTPLKAGDVCLKVHNLTVRNDLNLECLHGISFDVRAGEVLGVAGVSGNGQRELAETIAGLRSAESGEAWIGEHSILHAPIEQRLKDGLSFVPEERNRHGIIGPFTVAENAILQNHAQTPFARGPFFDFSAIARHTGELIRRFNIKTPAQSTAAKNLSGGNVQKLIIGRELSRKPTVLIAAQPTRGVDISATEYIHNVLMQQRADGMAILLISEDLDEVMALSDRIAVMYEGQIVAIVDCDQADVETLGLMMAGVGKTA